MGSAHRVGASIDRLEVGIDQDMMSCGSYVVVPDRLEIALTSSRYVKERIDSPSRSILILDDTLVVIADKRVMLAIR